MLRVGYDAQAFLSSNGGLGKGTGSCGICSAVISKSLPASRPRHPINPA